MLDCLKCLKLGKAGIFAAGVLFGTAGLLQPTTSALLHNTSTLAISLKSMGNLLEDEKNSAPIDSRDYNM